MQKIKEYGVRVFLVFCFFVSPLIFLTDFTRNPYMVQNALLVFGGLGAIFLLALDIYKQKNFCFSKADIALLVFTTLVLFSLILNILAAANSAVVINEFLRRGEVLITNLLCGYFLARFISNSEVSAKLKVETNYKTGLLLLLWGFLWLPFSYFRMKTLFDIYAVLVWAAGIYIALKFLKEITVKNILDIMLPVCALACAYGICQNLGFDFLWPFDIGKDFGNRSISTFGNPNFLSSFILLVLPLSVIYLLCAKTKGEKFYYFLISLLYTTCLALTQTRSSWLGAGVGFIILFSAKDFRNLVKQNKKIFISFLLLAGALFFFWPEGKKGEYKSLVFNRSTKESLIKPADFTLQVKESAINTAYHQRLIMWTCGLDNFKQKPLLGWGWGSWQLTFAPCQGKILKKYPPLADLKTQANCAHNIFIETLSQSGILGLGAYLVFLLFVLICFRKFYVKGKEIPQKLFVLSILASVLAFLTDNMLNITSQITLVSFGFYFFVGILASLEIKPKKLPKVLTLSLLVLIALVFLFFNYRNYKNIRASVYAFKAYKEVGAKRFYRAKTLLDKSLSLSNNSAEDYYLQVHTLLNNRDFNALERLLKKALKYFPYFYEFYFIQAEVEETKANYKEAFLYLKKTLTLYPYYEPALKAVLRVLYLESSLRTIENAKFIEEISLPLSYRNAYALLLGQIYFEQGSYQKAREIFLKELSQNIFDLSAQEKLKEVNKKLGIKEDSVLKEAIKMTNLRKQVLSAGKISPALFALLQKEAGSLEGKMLLAQGYFKNKDYQKSREILQSLYKEYPAFLPLNFAYASLEEALDNKEEAKKYLNAILKIDKSNTLALRRLEKLN